MPTQPPSQNQRQRLCPGVKVSQREAAAHLHKLPELGIVWGVLVFSGICVQGVVFSNGVNYLTLIFFHLYFSSRSSVWFAVEVTWSLNYAVFAGISS
jgi:hypothetical protein